MKGNYVIQLRLVAIMETQLSITINVIFILTILNSGHKWNFFEISFKEC